MSFRSDSQPGAESPLEDAPTTALFEGDLGALSEPTRRALVQLLRGPSLDARQHSKLWPALLRDENVIRGRLHELFLELTLDRDEGVAFTTQAPCAELAPPKLLRRVTLTYFESALVIFLRQRLTHFSAEGSRAVVSDDEMRDHLLMFERPGDTDQARFRRQMDVAIAHVNTLGLLRKIRGSPGRYEVSPALKLLFGADQIQALNQALLRPRASIPDADTAGDDGVSLMKVVGLEDDIPVDEDE